MNFVLNNTVKKSFSSFQISVNTYNKKNTSNLEYYIKILDKENDLFGRKSILLRKDMNDGSMMRTKLTCDLLNRLGIPSLSANYCHLYINGEFMGLYILQDIYRQSWIKSYYNNDNSNGIILYQCKKENSDLTENNLKTCNNLGSVSSYQPLADFLSSIKNVSSRSEVESIMDVDEFIKVWIIEWLIGSWDHMLKLGKNYYLYKQDNGKWQILLYNFDSTFGHFELDINKLLSENIDHSQDSIDEKEYNVINERKRSTLSQQNIGSYFNISRSSIDFPYWYSNRPIVDALVASDYKFFLKNLYEIIERGFNPEVLFQRIDELETWLDPYIKEDRSKNNGILPNHIHNNSMYNNHTFEEFKLDAENTTINYSIGIKEWIQERYNFVCEHYKMNCNDNLSNLTNNFNNIFNSSNKISENNFTSNEYFNKYFWNINNSRTSNVASSSFKKYIISLKYIYISISLIISLII